MNEREPIVTKGTRPLPYIQRGMLLVSPDEDGGWWEVETITGPSPCTATLRSEDIRRINVPCPELEERWSLHEDFDPCDLFDVDDYA